MPRIGLLAATGCTEPGKSESSSNSHENKRLHSINPATTLLQPSSDTAPPFSFTHIYHIQKHPSSTHHAPLNPPPPRPHLPRHRLPLQQPPTTPLLRPRSRPRRPRRKPPHLLRRNGRLHPRHRESRPRPQPTSTVRPSHPSSNPKLWLLTTIR